MLDQRGGLYSFSSESGSWYIPMFDKRWVTFFLVIVKLMTGFHGFRIYLKYIKMY